MTETTSTAAEPARIADKDRSPGEYLRKLREEKGHTHAAVGTALHLTVHYIKALEGDEYGKLPGLTFVKGYLRSYARFLGADVDNVIGRFDEHIAGLLDAGMHTARVERSKRRQDQALRWGIGAGFVVVAGLVAGWWFLSGRHGVSETVQRNAPVTQAQTASASPPPVTTAAAPQRSVATLTNTAAPVATPTYTPSVSSMTGAVAATGNGTAPGATMPTTLAPTAFAAGNAAAPTRAAPESSATTTAPVVTSLASGSRNVALISAGNDELRVTFNGNSWIEVDDGNMVRLYNDMLRTGDTLTILGTAPFHVLLGDASHVAISVNSAAVDISADIRDDSTARLVLAAPVTEEAPAANEESAANEAPAASNEGAQQ